MIRLANHERCIAIRPSPKINLGGGRQPSWKSTWVGGGMAGMKGRPGVIAAELRQRYPGFQKHANPLPMADLRSAPIDCPAVPDQNQCQGE